MNKDVNIEEIIDFIKSNLTNKVNLINNLETIESGEWESKAYYRFVDSKNANQSGPKWKFKDTIILEYPKHKTIILDILEDDHLGGIEFYEYLR